MVELLVRCVVIAALLSGLSTSSFYAQMRTGYSSISDERKCAQCRLNTVEAFVLGSDQGAGYIPGHPVGAAMDSRGRVILAFSGLAPVVFERSGRVAGSLGRIGNGPGELRGSGPVSVGAGDTILVRDGSSIAVFAPDMSFIRRISLEVPLTTTTRLSNGQFIGAGPVPMPELAGLRFHLVGASSGILRSFAVDSTRLLAEPRVPHTLLASAASTRFWSVYQAHYELELWDTLGVRHAFLRREPPSWWMQYRPGPPANPAEPKLPSGVHAFRADARGRLWLAVRSQSPRWPPSRTGGGGAAESNISQTPFHEMFETVLEAIDPGSATLVVSERLPRYVFAFLNDNHFASYEEDARGIPRVRVWRFEVIGGQP